jgi:beta-glucosidase
MLREYHLPSFAAGVSAGAHSLMINSGEINGTPVHASKALLTDLLKTELKFNGFAVSDWQDIEYLYLRHHVAESHKEAVALAVNAGVDMSMVPYNFDFADYLVALVKEGKVPMSRIDDAVSRILRVKMHLGLFETPLTIRKDYPDFGSDKFIESARNTAIESITLLKNEQGILPLSMKNRILVAGPAANRMRPMTGGWSYSWQGDLADEFAAEYLTIFKALQAKASVPENVKLYEGVRYGTGDNRNEIVDDLNIFSKMASQSDVIVLCLGENSYTETPGNLTDLTISENQQELVKLAAKSGKPLIIVLVEGRPRIISMIEPMAAAIVHAYLPGNYGGEAITKVLFGEANPSGKLPYTYPRFANSLEPYYHKLTEQIETSGAPVGTTFNPQYEFGFGLSYADFTYSDLRIDKTVYNSGEIIRCSLTVTNNSNVSGKEVVQVYISDHYASITPSVKRLRAFEKLLLQPGESKRVSFEIPVSRLAFVDASNQWIVEKGSFTLQSGVLSTDFTVEDTKVYK